MRTQTIALAAASLLAVLAATPACAEVNCAQVKRYLDIGRKPEDVADTMVIPLDEVKRCQASAATKPAPPAGSTAGAPAAPAAEAGKKP